MALETVTDTLEGREVDFVLHAAAWQQPISLSWFERCRNVGNLLRSSERATHLLRIVDTNGELETWHAGRTGVSIAAALEKVAIDHESIRDAVVLVPLANRTYYAEMKGALVQTEGALFAKAAVEKTQSWIRAKRRTVQVSLLGQRTGDIPQVEKLDIELSLDGFWFARASNAMLRAHLVRLRDCILLLVVLCLLASAWLGLRWFSQVSFSEVYEVPLEVRHLEPEKPSPQAGPTLAMVAAVLANREEQGWASRAFEKLTFDPDSQILSLFIGSDEHAVVEHRIEIEPVRSSASLNIKLAVLRARLQQLLQDMSLTADWEEAFETTDAAWAQRFRVSLQTYPTLQLLDLADFLKTLPIRLVSIECFFEFGNLQTCDLIFAIQGQGEQS